MSEKELIDEELENIRERLFYGYSDDQDEHANFLTAIGDVRYLMNYIYYHTYPKAGFISSHAVPGGKK